MGIQEKIVAIGNKIGINDAQKSILEKELTQEFSDLINKGKEKQEHDWKMWGAIIVSIFLILILGWGFIITYSFLGEPPIAMNISNIKGKEIIERIDFYTRAKDIFMFIFPLFSALTSFWLGYAIQDAKTKSAEKNLKESRTNEEKKQTELEQIKKEGFRLEKKITELRTSIKSLKNLSNQIALNTNSKGEPIPDLFLDHVIKAANSKQANSAIMNSVIYLTNHQQIIKQLHDIEQILDRE